MSELVAVEQPLGESDAASWILDRHGNKVPVPEDSRRTAEIQRGLERHERVRVVRAHTPPEEAQRIVGALHEPHYLAALKEIDSDEPALLPEWKPPGLPADCPVWRGVATSAFEGMRTAIAAAQLIGGGARFVYAVGRPPGHHAGPAWMGGYCYLNVAAAAAYALQRCEMGQVAILDIDFHFPTGTKAMVERMKDVRLHSLHASTLEEIPWKEVPEGAHERFVGFGGDPGTTTYLEALEESLTQIAGSSQALVLSLGYDIVGGDPHGSWSFPVDVFADIGRALAASGLPVCVVQEGGYAVEMLADCAEAFAGGLLGQAVGKTAAHDPAARDEPRASAVAGGGGER